MAHNARKAVRWVDREVIPAVARVDHHPELVPRGVADEPEAQGGDMPSPTTVATLHLPPFRAGSPPPLPQEVLAVETTHKLQLHALLHTYSQVWDVRRARFAPHTLHDELVFPGHPEIKQATLVFEPSGDLRFEQEVASQSQAGLTVGQILDAIARAMSREVDPVVLYPGHPSGGAVSFSRSLRTTGPRESTLNVDLYPGDQRSTGLYLWGLRILPDGKILVRFERIPPQWA